MFSMKMIILCIVAFLACMLPVNGCEQRLRSRKQEDLGLAQPQSDDMLDGVHLEKEKLLEEFLQRFKDSSLLKNQQDALVAGSTESRRLDSENFNFEDMLNELTNEIRGAQNEILEEFVRHWRGGRRTGREPWRDSDERIKRQSQTEMPNDAVSTAQSSSEVFGLTQSADGSAQKLGYCVTCGVNGRYCQCGNMCHTNYRECPDCERINRDSRNCPSRID